MHQKFLLSAIIGAIKKFNPLVQAKNPVMFVVYVGAIVATGLFIGATLGYAIGDSKYFVGMISFWLWATLLFANLAESIAEGHSKAQAQSLKSIKRQTFAKKISQINRNLTPQIVSSDTLRLNDLVLVEEMDFIPCDGVVVDGCASVDESAITGESAPVIRKFDDTSCKVTGGTQVISDWIIVKINVNPGESFLDQMIMMVEGAKRQKTPNEIALNILLIALTIIFLIVTITLLPMSIYSTISNHIGTPVSLTILIALLVCLIPTTIGGLISSIGIAGIGRMMKANVIATSGRAIEAAGDVDVLLIDKTGTITYGNRQASEFYQISGVDKNILIKYSLLASLADETPEGQSIVNLATKQGIQLDQLNQLNTIDIPFTAVTKMSGVHIGDDIILKGSIDAIQQHLLKNNMYYSIEVQSIIELIAAKGSTPLVVIKNNQILGVIELKDIIKEGIKEKFAQLRQMGIKIIMLTGDNKLTAAHISAEVGADTFFAEVTPDVKLSIIRQFQEHGSLVAMTGDGTNDAPALAQADVAVAMYSGTQAAKEAANMIDLDSSPTKLIQIIEIGKQMLITRGALTTFSIANDIAKYFAILPATFASTYPVLTALNIMHLNTPESAVLSAIIFNALIIIVLIPLALRGVQFKPMSANKLLLKNVLIYGCGGVIAPFVGIKLIDIILQFLHLTK